MSRSEKGRPTDERAEIAPGHVVRVIVRRSLKPVASKELISLRIGQHQDVIECLEAQGPGCQTRVNSVLRFFRYASAG